MTDKIRPQHYKGDGLETIEVIDAFGLGEGFRLGNVVKYVLRYTRTRNADDLRKAKQYIDFELSAIAERQAKEYAQHKELAK